MTQMFTQDEMIRKVRAMLDRAEHPATPPREAESASAMAHQIMTKYAIDQAALAAQGLNRSYMDITPHEMKIVFSDNKMHLKQKAMLLHFIALTNRCQCVIIDENEGHLFGYKEDMEFVEILFWSLHAQMQHAANVELREVRKLKDVKNGYAWKRNFFLGYADRLHDRLAKQQANIVKETEARSSGTELILADRSLAVKRLMEDYYPELRAGRKQKVSNGNAFRRGADAADAADISGGRTHGMKEIG